MRLALVKYLLKWNSFSSSVSCLFVKFVRAELLLLFNNNELLIAVVGSPIAMEKDMRDHFMIVQESKCRLDDKKRKRKAAYPTVDLP